MAGFPESAHLHRRAGFLLCHRVLHRRERAGERGGDRAMRQSSGPRRHLIVRRALQDRVLLPRYRVRDDLYSRVPAEAVRRAQPVQVRALCDVDHRRGRDTAVLHWTRNHRQRRRVGRIRDAACVPRIPYLQVLAPLAGTTNPRLHLEILRVRAGFPCVLTCDGDHHLRHCYVLRGEKRRRHQLHFDTLRLLVYHRHDDYARVSAALYKSMSITMSHNEFFMHYLYKLYK